MDILYYSDRSQATQGTDVMPEKKISVLDLGALMPELGVKPVYDSPYDTHYEKQSWQSEKRYNGMRDSVYAVTLAEREAAKLGHMPSSSNMNYRFVEDRRPTGEENEQIPNDEFTAYFANGLIPIAAHDHKEHSHDLGHVAGYRKLLDTPGSTDHVQLAATNASGNTELEEKFTKVIDIISNNLRNLETTTYYDVWDVPGEAIGIRDTHLPILFDLAYPGMEPLELIQLRREFSQKLLGDYMPLKTHPVGMNIEISS